MIFSLVTSLAPITSRIFGAPALAGTLVFLFFKIFYYSSAHLSYSITYGVPSLVAAITWFLIKQEENTGHKILNYRNYFNLNYFTRFFLQVLIPLTCVFLFIIHPVGHQALGYSLYWFICPLTFFVKTTSEYKKIFFNTLNISFLMHALGSILWLYALPTTHTYWLALIPRVALERLLFTSYSFVFYYICQYVRQFYLTKRTVILCSHKNK
jgi:hypothetical protein